MKVTTCGCCEIPPATPLTASNRPGLSAIVFRVGTYQTFRASMLQRIAGTPALSALQSRSDDDYAITLLDMWATVADILTFYQERIANEGFLRTARFRDSILRLARLLDYQLRPGVAATTFLAYTLDKNASLQLPAGLRVQSVPAEDEKPQIFETLESIVADGRLNRVRVLPAPAAANPLARGSTSGILAPGSAGLAAAATLSPGDHFVVFDTPAGLLEELAVRALRVDEDRIVLTWTSPVQASHWNITSAAYAFSRTFRIFGFNAPNQYMEAVETPPSSGKFIWTRRTFTTADFVYTPTGGVFELDSKHEGITVGSRLLISESGSHRLVTVTAVSQGSASFKPGTAGTTPLQETVTRVTVTPAPTVGDRTKAVIYEIKGSRIAFWGYDHPRLVSGATVYVPARRTGPDAVVIGRRIEKNAYTEGAALPLSTIDISRQVLVADAKQGAIPGVVARVAPTGLDVDVGTTPEDLTTALELRLDADSALRAIVLRSATLPASLTLTSTVRQLTVTIGPQPPRVISLTVLANPAQAAASLQAALTSSLPAVAEFAQSAVFVVESALIVLPGGAGAAVTFGPTDADPTTVRELGLQPGDAIAVDALLSGDLSTVPSPSNPFRKVSIRLGPLGPRTIAIGAFSTLAGLAAELMNRIRAADPAPAFALANVSVAGTRVLVLPGTGGAAIQEYLALDVDVDTAFHLDAASAVLLGNVALASHGETIADEVLGDGDASVAFQHFELAKKPLTYTPSAGPGGVASTLRVLVDDVLWSEVPTFFGHQPTDQIYTARIADDGAVTLRFSDGRAGARPPSGRANITADYRQGSGLQGRVRAGSLRSPLDLPVGLKSVVNPVSATGGADPESLEQARQNAPTTVRTFGRAVSLRDFEDLVRSSGEVAKALATWVWNGGARAVHLTVAAQQGQPFTTTDLRRIHASLTAERDPNHALFLANFTRVPVVVAATVRVRPTYVARKVADAATTALLTSLAFDTLRFGQPLALSEIYSVLQHVPGVEAVDIDLFQFKDRSAAFLAERGATSDPVQRSLRIHAARPNVAPPPLVLAAELAHVETPAEDIRIVTSGGLPE